MTTQPSTAAPSLSLEEAEIQLQEVRKRIGAGDPGVTVRDLEHGEAAVRFARTRLDAARELEAERAEQARLAHIEEVRQALPAAFDTTDLDKARARMESAIDAYCREASELQQRTSEVWNEVSNLGPGTGMTAQSGDGSISANGTTYRRPSVQAAIRQAATDALKKHFPRTQIDLNRT
jgi:hypothetical protein